MKYETERVASQFYEGVWLNPASCIETPEIQLDKKDKILYFGVYTTKGNLLIKYGNAPSKIVITNEVLTHSNFYYKNGDKSVVFTRPIGPPGESQIPFGYDDKMLKKSLPQAVLCLELKFPDYFNRKQYNRLFAIGIVTLLTLIISIIIYLLKKTQEYRLKMLEQMEMAHLGEVSRLLSHEIKNPLSAIRIQTSLLRMILSPHQLEEVNIIDEEISRLGLLTQRISDFIVDPYGNPELVALDYFIPEIMKRFNYPIHFSNTSNKKQTIMIDKERLRTIIENIIKNAIESYANQNDPESMPVIITLNEDNGLIIVSFQDKGKGFSPGALGKLFTPFFTDKPGGSGIGLFLVKRFTEAALGQIKINSSEGQGTEVILFFRRK
jgi:signal transduction histidine kinase